MQYGKDHKAEARSVFMSSIEWLANLGAGAATFFLTPIVSNFTMGWVTTFTRHYYGEDILIAVEFAWVGLTGLFIFFIARMSMGTVLVLGGLAFAARFLQ